MTKTLSDKIVKHKSGLVVPVEDIRTLVLLLHGFLGYSEKSYMDKNGDWSSLN